MNNQRTIHKQLINKDRQFDRSAIENVSATLSQVNQNYFSVAIIGVQNSGKSTLLNFLFGTNFDVLKQVQGTRTTLGIFLSLDKQSDIIVLDVEGNDAMDRAEEQEYQKMVATYALITANVLIINIWLKSLGGHTGSQYQTLKTIMEICIDQFKQDNPKTILFCVRDFNEQYENEYEIKSKIKRDVNKLWNEVEKPEQLKKYSTYEKFFNIQVVVLHRYRQNYPEKFVDDVSKLRARFVDKTSEDYIFQKQKIQYNLPIKDLPQLTENSWKSIKENKKLNLPKEKEQLANFRCSSIVNEIEAQFNKEMLILQKKPSANFGEIKEKYMNMYDQKTYQYGKQIVENKKNEMIEGFDDQIKKIIISKVNQKVRDLQNEFSNQAKHIAHKSDQTLEDELKNLINIKVEEFIAFMKSMNYAIPNRKDKLDELQAQLKNNFNEIKDNILETTKNQFQKESSRTIRLLASQLLKKNFGVDFWPSSINIFKAKTNQLMSKYRDQYIWITGQEMGAIQYDNFIEQINIQFKNEVKKELEKTLINKVFEYFLNQLKVDSDNHSLNFTLMTQEQIGAHFDKTRDSTNLLIYKLNEFTSSQVRRSSILQEMDQGQYLFQSTWLSTTVEQIDKKMINQYEQIIRRKKQRQMGGIPWWLIIFIIFFVYDDLWFPRQEYPTLFYILMIPLLIILLLYAIGQGSAVQQIFRITADKMKEFLPFLR